MPARLTRYVMWEIAKPFAFFVIVFTGLVWLTQALRVLDTVVTNGQTALVFLEFSALILPVVLSIALPLAAFGATVHATNRLLSESEIVAMLASGVSAAAIARPAAVFGSAVMAVTAVSSMYLEPTATQTLRDRVAEVRADIASALLFEGRFLHPASGLTVFVAESGADGAMRGVFVHDRRDGDAEVTYTAEEAVLTEEDDAPRLVLFAGSAQRIEPDTRALSLLYFDRLALDLGQLQGAARERARKPSERYARELIAPTAEQLGSFSLGDFVAEGHEQISAPLYAVAMPMVAVAASLGAGFTRRGYAARVGVAVTLGAALRLLGVAAKALTTGAPALWPLMYAAPVLGALAAWWFLAYGDRLTWRRSRAA